jgi:hypothetical protein
MTRPLPSIGAKMFVGGSKRGARSCVCFRTGLLVAYQPYVISILGLFPTFFFRLLNKGAPIGERSVVQLCLGAVRKIDGWQYNEHIAVSESIH